MNVRNAPRFSGCKSKNSDRDTKSDRGGFCGIASTKSCNEMEFVFALKRILNTEIATKRNTIAEALAADTDGNDRRIAWNKACKRLINFLSKNESTFRKYLLSLERQGDVFEESQYKLIRVLYRRMHAAKYAKYASRTLKEMRSIGGRQLVMKFVLNCFQNWLHDNSKSRRAPLNSYRWYLGAIQTHMRRDSRDP